MAEQVILDPSEIATGRTQLNINDDAIVVRQEGIDWGNSEIAPYMSESLYGSSAVDYRIPNRTVRIPLRIKDTATTDFSDARQRLQQKVGLLQREGGWIKRVLGSGGTLYADVVSASLSMPGDWMQAHRESQEALLDLEVKPDFYEPEITLTDHTETAAAELIFTETAVKGSYPARCRIVVDDDQNTIHRALIWSFRSKHYSAASTAALAYEAEALGVLDSAIRAGTATLGTGGTTASGGTVVRHGTIGVTWTPVVDLKIGGTAYLTHTGTNRVYARIFSTSGTTVQTRLVWDVGDLVNPVENTPWRVVGHSGGTAFTLADLGSVRLDSSGLGTHRWTGQIEAKGDVGTENFAVDKVWIVNTDEGAGMLRANIAAETLSSFVARDSFNQTTGNATGKTADLGGVYTGAGDADDFTIDATNHRLQRTATSDSANTGRWLLSGASNQAAIAVGVAPSGLSASSSIIGGVVARYVDTANHFRAVVSVDTVTGFATVMVQKVTTAGGVVTLASVAPLLSSSFELAVSVDGSWSVTSSGITLASGSDSDLATGGTLATGKVGIYDQNTTATAATRTYDGFYAYVPTSDAVIYPSQSAQLTTQGMYREDTGGTAYAPVSMVNGDLPRLPIAGYEGRTTQVFIKTSPGDIYNWGDTSPLPDLSARISYNPCHLFVPED
jgi:hypothetical protein